MQNLHNGIGWLELERPGFRDKTFSSPAVVFPFLHQGTLCVGCSAKIKSWASPSQRRRNPGSTASPTQPQASELSH